MLPVYGHRRSLLLLSPFYNVLLSLSLVAAFAGCLHPSNNAGEGAINLAQAGDFLFVSRGEAGLDVVRVSDGELMFHEDPSGLVSSFDDVSARDSLLLALDADDGRLVSFRVDDAGALTKADEIEVATGPYSGVALGLGRAVVSGGTCEVTVLRISSAGELEVAHRFSASRGQPDVSIDPTGASAILSTHFSSEERELTGAAEFGVSLLELESAAILDTLGLDEAGFTEGGGTPASWPVRAAFRDGALFVAHGGGLSEIELSPAGLTLARTVALEGPAVDVSIHDGRAFVVVATPPSVAEIDLESMEVRQSFGLPDGESATAVIATTDWVYVAGNATGLLSIAR